MSKYLKCLLGKKMYLMLMIPALMYVSQASSQGKALWYGHSGSSEYVRLLRNGMYLRRRSETKIRENVV